MEYRFAGGDVAAIDYDVCTNVLREGGPSVSEAIRNLLSYTARTGEAPEEVRAWQDGAAAKRMAALREINDLVDAAPSMLWEDDSRDAVRSVLESRYM